MGHCVNGEAIADRCLWSALSEHLVGFEGSQGTGLLEVSGSLMTNTTGNGLLNGQNHDPWPEKKSVHLQIHNIVG